MQTIDAVYTALDQGRFSQALTLCDKGLKRQPNSKQLLYLKVVSHVNLLQHAQAVAASRTFLSAHGHSFDSIKTIFELLKHLQGQLVDEFLIDMTQTGYEKAKTEKLGRLWFMCCVKAGRVAAQRKAAGELQKAYTARDYFWWMVVSMFLVLQQAADGSAHDKLLPVLLHRMVMKATQNTAEPKVGTSEELYLVIDVLQHLGHHRDLLAVLSGPLPTSVSIGPDAALAKAEALYALNMDSELCDYCLERLSAGQDDWLFYTYLIAASVKAGRPASTTLDQLDDRIPRSSRNYLLGRMRAAHADQNGDAMQRAVERYWDQLGSSPVAYEDLAPYVASLAKDEQSRLLALLPREEPTDFKTAISACNCIRLDAAFEGGAAADLLRLAVSTFEASLPFGQKLLKTDNQHGNDALLVASELLSRTDSEPSRFRAVGLLEYAAIHSPHDFQLRLRLVDLYRELGAWSLAAAHLRTLSLKQVQHDTVAHLLLHNAQHEFLSTMQLNALLETQKIYAANDEETPDMLVVAFERGAFSKVSEIAELRTRLADSYWRYRGLVDALRLRVVLDKLEPDSYVPELPTVLYDNRSQNLLKTIVPGPIPDIPTAAKRPPPIVSADLRDELEQDLQALRIVKSLLTQKRSELSDQSFEQDTSATSPYAAYASALHDVVVSGSDAAKTRLRVALEQTTAMLPTAGDSFDRKLVTALGAAVERLKLFALVAVRHQAVRTAALPAAKALHHALTARCEQIARDLPTRPFVTKQEIGSDNIDVDAIARALRAAQMESIVAVMAVLKTIRL